MIKGKLKCGDAMYVVRVEHFVTQRVFATALTENYYSKGESFPENMTKKEAEKILRHRLFFNGINGEIEDGYFESSYEEGEKFNAIYYDVLKFIKLKYPWLSENDG